MREEQFRGQRRESLDEDDEVARVGDDEVVCGEDDEGEDGVCKAWIVSDGCFNLA